MEGFPWVEAEFIQSNKREGTCDGGSLGISLLVASDIFDKIWSKVIITENLEGQEILKVLE